MRHTDHGRTLWAWIKDNRNASGTFSSEVITDTYGDKARKWTFKIGKETLEFVTREIGGINTASR